MVTQREISVNTASKAPLATSSQQQDAQSKLEECLKSLDGVRLADREQEVEQHELQGVREVATDTDAGLEVLEESERPGLGPGRIPTAKANDKIALSKEEQLLQLGLGQEHLSEAGRKHLQAIAGVSGHLGLITTDKSAVLAAVVELRQQQWAAEDSQAGTEEVSRKVQGQMEVLREHVDRLRVVSEEVRTQQASKAPQLEEKLRKKVLMDAKADNYVEELIKLQSKLDKLGFRPELRHEALAERSAALAAKHAEIEQLQQKLGFFKDLPADSEAAEQIYAQKHGRMLEATKQFENGLAQL